MRAEYEVEGQEAGSITIRDVGHSRGRMTVTNDAAAVVADLVGKGLLPEGRRLLYFDSQGELGEMLILDGRFAGFAFVDGSSDF